VSYEFTGAPEPEVAAAIIAAVESVLRPAVASDRPAPPPWLVAGIRDNLRTAPPIGGGIAWRIASLSS
jgi:hypothetical protein